MSLIEIPKFNWSGTYKKIELGAKQRHIIESLFELAQEMGGVSFACAAYRVLQLAPQVLEEERRLNKLPAKIYCSSSNTSPASAEEPFPPPSNPTKPPICAADLI